nr:uncharacterized protein LOC105498491 [Macaca nemestrina]
MQWRECRTLERRDLPGTLTLSLGVNSLWLPQDWILDAIQQTLEIPWNETNGSPGFGRVSSEQMGQQQPERLLPLAENTILDLTILFVTPRDGPGTEKWMAAVTAGEDCLRLPGRGSGARFSSRTDSRPSSQGVKGG